MNQTSESGDAAGCDWEISETDLLIFDSPDDVEVAKKLLDPSTDWYSRTSDMQNIQKFRPVEQGYRNEIDNPSTQRGDGSYLKEFSGMQGMLVGSSQENDIEGSLDDKTDEVSSFIPKSYLLCITLFSFFHFISPYILFGDKIMLSIYIAI